MTLDPTTMEKKLCSDDGWVHGDYLAEFNRMYLLSASFGDKRKPVEEPFMCTGSAHVLGEHILCTSPAHEYDPDDAFKGAPGTAIIIEGVAHSVSPDGRLVQALQPSLRALD